MREIHDLINALSPDNETEIQSEDDRGHHGARNRYRHRGKNRSNVGMDLKIFIQLLTLHQLL